MTDEDILAGLDFDTPEVEAVVDVTQLNDYELSCLDRDIRQELINRGEMHTPLLRCSDEGRRLHLQWVACKVELSKRRHPGST